MARVQRFDVGSVRGVVRTPQGGLRVPAAVTRTGVFRYVDVNGREVREYRPADEVFAPESLATLRGAPVTDLHPTEPVTAATWSALAKGHVCDSIVPEGEFVVTETGVEGSLVYALSAAIREAINQHGSASVHLDLLPQTPLATLQTALSKPRGSQSMAKHLHRQAGIDGVKAALLRELASAATFNDPALLASTIKALPITLVRPRPLDEAISTAGGVPFEQLDGQLMLKALPGTFCAGEMLDWEAPTGGYLLTACFASGRRAAQGILNWLQRSVE